MLATYAYDNLGNRTSVTFGNGATQAFTYDPVSRLASLTNDLLTQPSRGDGKRPDDRLDLLQDYGHRLRSRFTQSTFSALRRNRTASLQ